jgi:hypothetical protein
MTTKNQKNKTDFKPLRVTASITDLVRTNLKGLLSDKQSDAAIHNAFVDAYEEFIRTGKNGSPWSFKYGIPNFNFAKRDRKRWSMARLAAGMGVDVGVMRRIFDTKKKKGTDQLGIDEVIEMALIFEVTPGYLLQPLREHLERNATLFFENIGPNGFEVTAREWLVWVHGIRAPKGKFATDMEKNLMSLTPEAGMEIDSSRAIWPHEELDRLVNAQYTSVVSAMIHAQSNPLPAHQMSNLNIPSQHPFDSLTAAQTDINRIQRQTQATLAYMQHVRQAIRMIETDGRTKWVKEDIEWCLDRMREDLSAIAYFGDGNVPVKPNAGEKL